jgi:hypothetical protein
LAILIDAALLARTWSQAGPATLQSWGYTSFALLQGMLAALAVTIGLYGTRTPGSAMFGLALALAALDDSVAGIASLASPSWRTSMEVLTFVVGALAAGAFIRASQLFPKRLTDADLCSTGSPLRRRRRLRTIVSAGLQPRTGWALGVAWAALSLAQDGVASILIVAIGWSFFYIQWRVGSAIARRRVAWIMQAVLVFGILFVAHALLEAAGLIRSPELRSVETIGYNMLAAAFGLGSLGMAVFAAGAFNSTLIVRRTVATAALVAAILFVANVLTSAFVDELSDWIGLSDRLLTATLGTLAGLALTPFTTWFRVWATRSRSPSVD